MGCWRRLCQSAQLPVRRLRHRPGTALSVTDSAGGEPLVLGLRPIRSILRISVVTGRAGPGPGGRLPSHFSGGLCRRPGAWGLPAVVPSKPVSGPRARPPPGPSLRSLRSLRVLGGLETQRREPASGLVEIGNVGGPLGRPVFETLNHQGLLFYLRPGGSGKWNVLPRSRGRFRI